MIHADPRAALADAAHSFARASGPRHTHDVTFAGQHLRLEVVGQAMNDVVTPAFTPRAPSPAAALILSAWDAKASPLAPPEPERTAPIRVGDHYARDAEGRHIFWEPPWIYGFDPVERRAFFHCPDARELPSYTKSQPFLRLLHAWLRHTRAADLVHGAVIGRDDRGLLLAGPGGSGKSTLAIAAALSGWTYLGDDYVALHDGLAHGLYNIAKLVPEHLARHLPAAAAHAMGIDGQKTLLRVPLAPVPLPVRALVIPHVADADRLSPLSPARALLALAPSTLLQLPAGQSTDRLALGRLAALTRALPTWSLSLGRDASATLALLERELHRITG